MFPDKRPARFAKPISGALVESVFRKGRSTTADFPRQPETLFACMPPRMRCLLRGNSTKASGRCTAFLYVEIHVSTQHGHAKTAHGPRIFTDGQENITLLHVPDAHICAVFLRRDGSRRRARRSRNGRCGSQAPSSTPNASHDARSEKRAAPPRVSMCNLNRERTTKLGQGRAAS